ncbi:MAG: hypothetical protein M3N95_12265 [Actinomycetota bacterium]|nr:hypothetical protein [Actinomycetota bacterium]
MLPATRCPLSVISSFSHHDVVAHDSLEEPADEAWLLTGIAGEDLAEEPGLGGRGTYQLLSADLLLLGVVGCGAAVMSLLFVWFAVFGYLPWAGRVFVGVWVLLVGGALYICACRLAYRIDLDDGGLRWRALARSGTIELAELRAMVPFPVVGGFHMLTFGRRFPIVGPVKRGFPAFAEQVRFAAPLADIYIGLRGRVADRLGLMDSRWTAR